MNNNFWQKRINKFIAKQQESPDLKYDKFAKMEYKEVYNEAFKDLKSNNSRNAYRTMKAMANYNPNSKILDVKRGPLMGKYA